MADFKRYKEAIDAYRKSLAKQYDRGKWAVQSYLASVYHELGQLEEARACYQDALGLLAAEPCRDNIDTSKYAAAIKELLAQAITREAFRGERIQFGVQVLSHDKA